MTDSAARPSAPLLAELLRPSAALALALLAIGCGPERESTSAAEASRFLQQTTFGPTAEAIEDVRALGFEDWIDRQMALQPTYHRALVDELAASGVKNWTYDYRIEAWWRRSLGAEDQLRQRMAWALSQIFVISDRADAIQPDLEGLTSYYDLLVEHAFGSYRDLLEAVTLSPQMGGFLSMLQNQKPDPERNVVPDENYAREVMQLLSIGLVVLNPDGTPQLDEDERVVATYDQRVVEGMSHAFTGWNWASADEWRWSVRDALPMEPWEEYHDSAPKLLVTGVRTGGGETAREDLDRVLDLLVAHPNVGPFLGRQLIQRFVTSNPSPAYVARITAVFDDDGEGVRGNLGAVLKAILLDPEARRGHLEAPETYGKPREPILRLTALWRAFDARSASGWVDFPWPEEVLGQAPLRSPTVFNFYRPDHRPPGELSELDLAAPELALATHTFVTRITNELLLRIRAVEGGPAPRAAHDVPARLLLPDEPDAPEAPGMVLDLAPLVALAADPEALVDHLDLLLMAGQASSALRGLLLDHMRGAPADAQADDLVRDAIFLMLSSPDYALQL